MANENELLVDNAEYLEVGIHIGTKTKSPGMKQFIYKIREDGLYLLNLETVDEKIKTAAAVLARYEPKEIVVTASRIYAISAASKFAEIVGAKFMPGRVMPGIFTNSNRADYMEPGIILMSDTRNERQAIREASKTSIPVIALCDTDNWIKFVDLIIPCNNKGRRSLALVYFLLAREFLKAKGQIKTNEEFNFKISDFEAKVEIKAK
ncbi:MAG: 30S ribosomal protein S2 [Candidatus Micrarchaeota archaeon]|nr:30S ribosomal protein S2 [Candidatus Micrarchaeota archaeon]MDE1847798.1 30S ribosomal protein S2 [Candidatus Micrarchaeota archaeon]MDE1864236.1 30S ribosomal protein S2 [Candidatus Micrarchaeota archaeon]